MSMPTWFNVRRFLKPKAAQRMVGTKDALSSSKRLGQAFRLIEGMNRDSIETLCLVCARLISRDFCKEVYVALYRTKNENGNVKQ